MTWYRLQILSVEQTGDQGCGDEDEKVTDLLLMSCQEMNKKQGSCGRCDHGSYVGYYGISAGTGWEEEGGFCRGWGKFSLRRWHLSWILINE